MLIKISHIYICINRSRYLARVGLVPLATPNAAHTTRKTRGKKTNKKNKLRTTKKAKTRKKSEI